MVGYPQLVIQDVPRLKFTTGSPSRHQISASQTAEIVVSNLTDF